MRILTSMAVLTVVFAAGILGTTPSYATDEPPSSNKNETTQDVEKTSEDSKKEEKRTAVVQPGDSLSSIAEAHDTTWVRIFNANKNIENPDIINAGDTFVIPKDDEELEDRYAAIRAQYEAPVIAPAPVAATVPQSRTVAQPTTPRQVAPAPTPVRTYTANAGNRYAWGYCTWYVYNKRPDIGSFWGNANQWLASARAAGYRTGSAPVAGAIGVQGNHVVYVESVRGGMVHISEMNYAGGIGVVHTRTVPAGNFTYIY